MIVVLTIVVILLAFAGAVWLSGKIMEGHNRHEEEEGFEGFEEPTREPPVNFPVRGPVPFDHERDIHAPFGGRRI